MAAPTMIRRERKTCKTYFIPIGESVDSPAVVVSKTTWPDAAPITNYTNYQFKDIEELVMELATAEEKRKVPSEIRPGYGIETEKFFEGLAWTGTTAKTNSYLKSLQFAVPNIVVSGTAQAPGQRNMLWLDGVHLVELTDSAGVVIDRIQNWSRMFLQDPGAGAKAETSVLQVRWELLDAGNNTYLPV